MKINLFIKEISKKLENFEISYGHPFQLEKGSYLEMDEKLLENRKIDKSLAGLYMITNVYRKTFLNERFGVELETIYIIGKIDEKQSPLNKRSELC